jgi:hypothetical protein
MLIRNGEIEEQVKGKEAVVVSWTWQQDAQKLP